MIVINGYIVVARNHFSFIMARPYFGNRITNTSRFSITTFNDFTLFFKITRCTTSVRAS